MSPIDLTGMSQSINDGLVFGVYLCVALTVLAVLAAISDWIER